MVMRVIRPLDEPIRLCIMVLPRIILDFDDAQANLAGHFSTVLYSALLAVLEPQR